MLFYSSLPTRSILGQGSLLSEPAPDEKWPRRSCPIYLYCSVNGIPNMTCQAGMLFNIEVPWSSSTMQSLIQSYQLIDKTWNGVWTAVNNSVCYCVSLVYPRNIPGQETGNSI